MAQGGAFSGANLMALMKSRKIVEKTLLSPVEFKGKTVSLAEYYIAFNELRDGWEKSPSLKNIQFPVTSDRNNFTLQHFLKEGGRVITFSKRRGMGNKYISRLIFLVP